MINFIKKLFGFTPKEDVVAEAPYKIEAPVVAPVVATPAPKPVSKNNRPRKPKNQQPKPQQPAAQSAQQTANKKAPNTGARRGRKPKSNNQ